MPRVKRGVTAQDIIRMAFFHIGKYGNGRTIASDEFTLQLLNAMIKEWRLLDDIDSSNNNFDFPSEWLSALKYHLVF